MAEKEEAPVTEAKEKSTEKKEVDSKENQGHFVTDPLSPVPIPKEEFIDPDLWEKYENLPVDCG